MRSLSGLDASFLYIETEATPMHIGSLCLLDPPVGGRGKFVTHVRAHLKQRLHLAPLLSQRLALMPFDLGHPQWVEADDVDLSWHIQGERLPKGSVYQALLDRVATLHAERLDRSRPLWQFTIIEGLPSGRIAFYSKIHHAALDGAAGVKLAHALLDLTATPRKVPPKRAKPAPGPGPKRRAMLGALLSNSLSQYAKLAQSLPEAVRVVARKLGEQTLEIAQLRDRWLAPKTRLNGTIGAERAFATMSLPLARVRTVAKAHQATVNDLLLALLGRALHDVLSDLGEAPARSLVAAVPFSLRDQDDTQMNNQVTMLPCTLASDAADVHEQLQRIQAQMSGLKDTTKNYSKWIPTDYPSLGAPWIVGGLAQLAAKTKLIDQLPLPVNLVISNVPGPPVTMFLAGAKIASYFPVSIVTHGLGLNVTVHSYADQLDFGLISAASALPDLDPLVRAIDRHWHALSHAADIAPAAPPVVKKRSPKKSPDAKAKTKRKA